MLVGPESARVSSMRNGYEQRQCIHGYRLVTHESFCDSGTRVSNSATANLYYVLDTLFSVSENNRAFSAASSVYIKTILTPQTRH